MIYPVVTAWMMEHRVHLEQQMEKENCYLLQGLSEWTGSCIGLHDWSLLISKWVFHYTEKAFAVQPDVQNSHFAFIRSQHFLICTRQDRLTLIIDNLAFPTLHSVKSSTKTHTFSYLTRTWISKSCLLQSSASVSSSSRWNGGWRSRLSRISGTYNVISMRYNRGTNQREL
jgi:hypothetical protein